MIIEEKSMRNKFYIFKSRHEAGLLLGNKISSDEFDFLAIIPSGGVPIAFGLLENPLISINKEIDLVIVRKIQIPGNAEAGMGAITPNGQIFLNEHLLNAISIENSELQSQIRRTKQEIENRRKEFKMHLSLEPNVHSKKVLIVDDGVASGFSLIAASCWLKSLGASRIIIGVPTAPLSSIQKLEQYVEKIFCLNIREKYPFAVADAYIEWYDLDLEETKNILKKIMILTKKN